MSGPPTQPQPTPPPKSRHRGLIVALAALGAILLIGVIGALVNMGQPTTPRAATAVTDPPTTIGDPVGDEPATTEEPAPEPTSSPNVKVGETLEMSDGFGDTVAEVTVGGPTHPSGHKGVRFSTGDEFNQPEHGLWFGAWVKVKALKDGVDTVYGDLHVAQGGRHYSGDACCPEGFEPTLDYATLSKGEVSEGWVIFDIRSRHGEIVITDYDGKRLGAWTF